MDVVFYAANGNRIAINISYDTSYISEDLRQVFFLYADASAFYMEHDVDIEFCVGVCHSVYVFCVLVWLACLSQVP